MRSRNAWTKGIVQDEPGDHIVLRSSDKETQVQVIIFQRRELIYSNRDRPQEKRCVYRKLHPGLSY